MQLLFSGFGSSVRACTRSGRRPVYIFKSNDYAVNLQNLKPEGASNPKGVLWRANNDVARGGRANKKIKITAYFSGKLCIILWDVR